ncbi:MAG: hypothetical protein GWP09_01550 [Nitrospiraceae bacterium]|nr:hypothetical protein [Nitrospiraceae bacterium]
MNKTNLGIITAFILVLGTLLTGFAFAAEVPISNLNLQLNGLNLNTNAVTKLNVLKGNELSLRLNFDATANDSNVEVLATIFGYEYNQYHSLTSESSVFNLIKNVTYVKYLTLKLPQDISTGTYKLRLYIADPDNGGKTYEYNLLINSERHNVKIVNVLLSPNDKISAGSYLISRVRVENDGLMTEKNVKVVVSIPELGLSQEDYIDKIDSNEYVSSNDLALKIPDCATAGDYKVYTTVYYNGGYENTTETHTISVLKSGTCSLNAQKNTGKTIISVPTSVKKGVIGQASTYTLSVINTGDVSKTFTVEAQNDDWATVTITPSNLLVLGPYATNTLTVSVTPKKGITAGDHVMFLTFKSQGTEVKQIPLTLTIKAVKPTNTTNTNENATTTTTPKPTSGISGLRTGLEITIVVLVIILIIIALIVGFTKGGKKEESESEEEAKTYY